MQPTTITASKIRATAAELRRASDADLRSTWAECLRRFSTGEADDLDRVARALVRREIVERTHTWHEWSDFGN